MKTKAGKGRPKNVETPELMWKLFEDYIIHTKSNPFLVKDWVGKDGNEIKREKEKPLTLQGFENYCRRKVGEVGQYFVNQDKGYTDFLTICHAIKMEIKQDQIEGGMAMIYNPSITQRLNGLTENIVQTNIEQPLYKDETKKDE